MRVPDVIVVDDFLADPEAVRSHALQQPFVKMHSAGVLFLTPNAPIEAGLSLFRGKLSGLRRRSSDPRLMELTFGESPIPRRQGNGPAAGGDSVAGL